MDFPTEKGAYLVIVDENFTTQINTVSISKPQEDVVFYYLEKFLNNAIHQENKKTPSEKFTERQTKAWNEMNDSLPEGEKIIQVTMPSRQSFFEKVFKNLRRKMKELRPPIKAGRTIVSLEKF